MSLEYFFVSWVESFTEQISRTITIINYNDNYISVHTNAC